MKIFTLHKKQKLAISLEEAWKYFSDPKNLKIITPDYMGFHILSGDEKPMFSGQIIQYIVRPFANIPTKWITEITHVEKEVYFVDEQRFGPYSLWHHLHTFKEINGGVEMEDVIHYKLPAGIIGTWLHPFLVKPKLDKIFEYRTEKLKELFGEL